MSVIGFACRLAAAGLLAGGLALPAAADETRIVEGFEGPAQGVGIEFRPILTIGLNGRVEGLEDRLMRVRVWTIEPGGIVPVHTHRNRPAFVYVLAGSILEYRNTSPEPHRANAGDLSKEGLGVVHYWRNDGQVPAILWAVDLYQDPNFTPEPMSAFPEDMTTSDETM